MVCRDGRTARQSRGVRRTRDRRDVHRLDSRQLHVCRRLATCFAFSDASEGGTRPAFVLTTTTGDKMSSAAKVGAFMLVILAILAYFVLKIEDINVRRHGGTKEIKAVFDSVAGLDIKSAVR